jgi:predicted flap endonuclease-1-like 5' DNA nuclease
MSKKTDQTLAVFLVDSGDSGRRLLKAVSKIDKGDKNVKIVDAAVADHHKRGRVTVKQTHDVSGRKGGVRGGSVGVIAGAVMLGPPGAAVGGAIGATLSGLYSRFRDIGIEDSFMRKIAGDIDRGKSAVFVQYEGDWSASIEAVKVALRAEKGELIHSTLPADKAAELQAVVAPAVDELGGAETVADYEVAIGPEAEAAPAEPAPEAASAAAPDKPAKPAKAAKASVEADDLSQLAGIGPKSAEALAAAGITTYAALAESNEPAIREAFQASGIVVRSNVSTWPMQASYAVKGDWRGMAKYNERQSHQGRAAPAKAKAAPKAPKPDDLTQISGIGPRMEMLLKGEGVTTYAALRDASVEDLRAIVARGGALPPSSLPTWPTQAAFAIKGDWNGLTAYNKSH